VKFHNLQPQLPEIHGIKHVHKQQKIDRRMSGKTKVYTWNAGPFSAEVAMLHPAMKAKKNNLLEMISIDGTSK